MRRALVVVLGVVLAVGGLVVVMLLVNSRDDAQLSAAPAGPGVLQPDHGASHAAAAAPAGPTPPTSGTHKPDLVTRDHTRLTDDQIIQALELGNVVILYVTPKPAAALEQLQEDVAGPFDAELAAAGQAVILARRAGAGPATALAWRRILKARGPADPALHEFAEAWLGRGIP